MTLPSFPLPTSLLKACATAVMLLTLNVPCTAQQTRPAAKPVIAPATVSVIMLSDLHVDPYHDPAKFERLRAAGAAQWSAILAEPESPTQAADFARLNTGCGLRGADSTSQLLTSALDAAHTQSPNALFVTVSGDLMAHDFDCRFKTLAPKATDADYSLFAYKTVTYVALELRRNFGKTPVYVALGNNDSGCGDYRESNNSPFLRALAASLGGAFTSGPDGASLAQQFAQSGGYSIRLPAPVVRGRLLVLQDLFLAKTYKDCEGKANAAATTAQTDWLATQLQQARAAHEQVWVMAHIPPGIDVYSTIKNKRDVCGGQAPTMFLADTRLAEVLTSYSDIVRLGIFAHTHLDEIHLLRASDFKDGAPSSVAVKSVASVSPINGNLPSFTIAKVDPKTATMTDYEVIAADNMTGVSAKWNEEYRFSTMYGTPSYNPQTLDKLLDGFLVDRQGIEKPSTDYQQNTFTGGGRGSIAVHLVWPYYACSLQHHTEASYKACVCPAK